MESHEVLRHALKQTSPKAIAADLGVSLSLVYKWSEGPSADSGARDPLFRLQQIIESSGDSSIVEWLCWKNGGHFVKNPDVSGQAFDHVLPATQELIGQFSSLLSQISQAAEDHSVTRDEASSIRKSWDCLKSYAEAFVQGCENGDFREMPRVTKPNSTP